MFSRKSSNPFFSENKFLHRAETVGSSDVMTINSTMTKFGFLFLLLLASAVFSWAMTSQGVNVKPYLIVSVIGGFILALVVSFKPKTAQYLAPIYALLEGVVIGCISALFSFSFRGVNENIIVQAVFLTLSVVVAMFLLYKFRIIRVTERLRSIIFGALVGVAVFYLLSFVLSLFGLGSIANVGGTMGIIISGVIVVVAAFSLLLDFDMIERGASQGAPKHMEWFAAFGLLVTIIWLYLEILRLLARLSSSKE